MSVIVPICETTVVSFDRSHFIGVLYDIFAYEVAPGFVDETHESYKCDFEHTGTTTTENMSWTIRCWNRDICKFMLDIGIEPTSRYGIQGRKYTINATLMYLSELDDNLLTLKFENDLANMMKSLQIECDDHDEEMLDREMEELAQDYADGKC